MACSIIETIKSRANAGNTAYIVVVKLLCDDYSDLPTQSGLSGYELAQGCIAHVINENKDYMIDSSGYWHVYGGDSWTNVYTKSETDALLDDKQDELTTAQLDAVNSGITAAKVQQYDDTVDNNKIIDISSQITAGSGYTVESTTHLYYQNKQVFGIIAVAINSGSYSSSLTAIAKLPVEYAPARQYLGSCGFSTDQWAITNIGYAFIQAANASSTAQRGQISVKSPTANLTHMILNVCYPVQIDVTF